MKIEDFMIDTARLGNGLIIKYNDKYVFAVGKEKFWKKEGNSLIITYTAAGGNVEDGETILESAYREGKEELGADILILSSEKTLVYDFRTKQKKIVMLDEEVRPCIIYNTTLNGNDDLSVCVYLAEVKDKPMPSMEVPALLLLNKEQVLEKKVHQLKELLEQGAEIFEQRPIPRYAEMETFGTASILKRLDYEDISFLLK